MIYLDSAALVKMIREEDETPELISWLAAQTDSELVSSALVEVEVPRALRRNQPAALSAVAPMISRIFRVEIGADVRAIAGAYMDSYLRSLDAIHLATAEILVASGKTMTAFVTYDKRLAGAAADAGLTVLAPGAG